MGGLTPNACPFIIVLVSCCIGTTFLISIDGFVEAHLAEFINRHLKAGCCLVPWAAHTLEDKLRHACIQSWNSETGLHAREIMLAQRAPLNKMHEDATGPAGHNLVHMQGHSGHCSNNAHQTQGAARA